MESKTPGTHTGMDDAIVFSEKYRIDLFNAFPLIIIFYNFQVASVLGRAVTLSDIFILLFTAYYLLFSKFSLKIFVSFLSFFFLFPLLSGLSGLNAPESLKSVIMLSFYSAFFFLQVDNSRIDFGAYFKVLVRTAVFLSVFGIIQYFLIAILGIRKEIIAYPFGPFTANPRGMIALLESVGTWRSNSFFAEPSVFGLFLVISLFGGSKYYDATVLEKALIFIGIITTKSTIVFMAFAVCLVLLFLERKPKNVLPLPKAINLRIVIPIALVIFVLAYLPVFMRILTETSVAHSSGYIRLVLPLYYIAYAFARHPLGLGIGVSDVYFRDNLMDMQRQFPSGEIFYSLIDNGVAQLIVTFGVFSIVYILLIVFCAIRLSKRSFPLAFVFMIIYVATATLYIGINWILMTSIYVVYRSLGESGDGSARRLQAAMDGGTS